MGFVSTLLSLIGFGFGVSVGMLIGYFFYIYPQPRSVKEPKTRQLRDMDTKSFNEFLPEIPLWIKNPDYERIDWLNKILHDMWPYLDKAICNTIRSTTKPIFDQYIGKYGIESVEFETLTLGTLPPIFQGIKVYELQEKELVIEPVIRWAGNANIVVDLKLFHFKFSAQPKVDFGFKLLNGDLMAIPGLHHFVLDTVAKQIAIMYHWPQVLELPILEASSGATKRPVGILRVKVVRAMDLLKMDLIGKSDPYVKLKLSGERLPSKRTSIKMCTLNPEWNENFKFVVKDPQTQVLELHLFDWEKVKLHDKLGIQVVPLRLLSPHKTTTFTLDLLKSLNLNDAHNRKNRGKLVVELTFDPFKEDHHWSMERHSSVQTGEEGDDCVSTGGMLLVTIDSAQDVEGKKHTNPYVEIVLKGEKKKTKVIKKSRDPRWDEEFQFTLDEAPIEDKIHIEVMNKRSARLFRTKESLGYVDIILSDVVDNGRINETYHLINSKNGTIHVEIKWITT
ncbi:synaptotagmin-3-like isoform X2 [Carex rostrata]